MKLSPISAIRLPCRRTWATSSVWVTLVLALCQSVPLVMAAFMRRSIFRMLGGCAVDFLKIQRIEALCQKSGQLGLWHTEDQISDGIGVRIAAAPLDRMTRGQTPDHAGFSPHLPDAIGAVDACRVLCPVLIKFGPGGGLDCKHGFGVVGVIVAWRGDPSQVPDQILHLFSVDGGVVPCHTVASLAEVATDLPIHHAALELLPGSLQTLTVGHTRFGGVVQELIVLNPEGSVPGFVVGVTVHCGSFG